MRADTTSLLGPAPHVVRTCAPDGNDATNLITRGLKPAEKVRLLIEAAWDPGSEACVVSLVLEDESEAAFRVDLDERIPFRNLPDFLIHPDCFRKSREGLMFASSEIFDLVLSTVIAEYGRVEMKVEADCAAFYLQIGKFETKGMCTLEALDGYAVRIERHA